MADPAAIIGLMASITTLATFVQDAFSKGIVLDKADLQKVLQTAEEAEATSSINTQNIAAVHLIDSDLQDVLEKRLRGVKNRLRDSYIIFDIKDLKDETERAHEEICFILEVIKSNNRGTLPTQDLNDWWQRAGCPK